MAAPKVAAAWIGDTPSTRRPAPAWRQRRASGISSPGRVLSGDDVAKLKAAGATTVVAARLDPDDVHEDEAAATVAKALAGEGIEVTAPFTGRCNHFAREAGLAAVDHERIDALNELDDRSGGDPAAFARSSRGRW
jgi:molybdenum cofactor cytidylyltransferase